MKEQLNNNNNNNNISQRKGTILKGTSTNEIKGPIQDAAQLENRCFFSSEHTRPTIFEKVVFFYH